MNKRQPAIPARHTPRMERIWKNRVLYMMLLFPLVLVVLFRYVPMYGIQIAFRNYQPSKTIWTSEWVGLKYIIKFINNYQFWTILKNTLVLGLYGIAVFPCSLILAICVNYLRCKPFQKTVQTISYLPHFITTVVMCSIILQMFDAKTGLVNAILGVFGVPQRNYMGIPSAFPHIYVWTNVWQDIGYASIIYIASLAGISPELHEAAMIDGATLLKRIWHVDIPGLLPTVCVLLIMRCGSLLNVGYEKVYLLQNPMNLKASEIINTYVYKQGLTSGLPQYSSATAIGLFVSIINLILLVTVNRISSAMTGNALW
ncbi:MAG: ABC transporter permease subunit [Eubacteriales bacterium]|nr:ABC transporter permease subunit [Eubacteriales bacterium]